MQAVVLVFFGLHCSAELLHSPAVHYVADDPLEQTEGLVMAEYLGRAIYFDAYRRYVVEKHPHLCRLEDQLRSVLCDEHFSRGIELLFVEEVCDEAAEDLVSEVFAVRL